MNRFTRLLLVLPLLATAPLAASDIDKAVRKAPVLPSLEAAVESFSTKAPEPVFIDLLGSERGAKLYRLKGFHSGEERLFLISGKAPKPARGKAAYNVVGGSTRCVVYLYRDVNYGTLILTSDLDWNNFAAISGVNDETSSLQTTCAPAWFHMDKNYASTLLYVPASTSLSSLGSADNKISAMLHDLP
jgi:hypothetical protein